MVDVLKEIVPSFDVQTREVDRKDVEKWLREQKTSVTFDIVMDKVRDRFLSCLRTLTQILSWMTSGKPISDSFNMSGRTFS